MAVAGRMDWRPRRCCVFFQPLSRTLVTKKIYTHSFALSVRDVLDCDLLASQASPGMGRELTGS